MADAKVSRENLTDILDNQQDESESGLQGQAKSQEHGDQVLEDWEIPKFRCKVRERIQEEIMKTGSQVPKTGDYLEEFAFSKAKSRKDYLDLIAGILIYVAEFNHRRLKAEDKEKSGKDTEATSVGPES